MKNGHLKSRTECTMKYPYPPESFIMIVCIIDYWKRLEKIGKDWKRLEKTVRQYFKTEKVVSLEIISHVASFISDNFIVPFSSISF